MKRTALATTLACVAALALPAAAAADGRELGTLREFRSRLAFDVGFASNSWPGVSFFTFSPELNAAFAVAPDLAVTVDWGFAHGSGELAILGSDSAFVAGNPMLAVHLRRSVGSGALRFGAGLALPVASLSDLSPIQFATHLQAAAMRGLWDLWLYDAAHLSLVAPLRYENLIGDSLFVAGDAALAIMVGTRDGADTELVTQLGGEVAYQSHGVRLGVMLQLVWQPTASGDNAQLSTAPFLRYESGGAFAQARVLLNLDRPYGSSFDDHGVWGLFIGGGAAI